MASGGDDFERLSGAVVLARLSNSSDEMDDSDDSLEVVYAGMDAGELEEVSSCGNLSGSDDNNESGRGNESVIDPSLPGPSSGSVGVSRHSSRLYQAENETDSSEESERSEDSLSDDDESERKRVAHVGKPPSELKFHKSPRKRNGGMLLVFHHSP